MNIESLIYIIALDKHKNFTLASQECCISQSSLSKHIKKIEEEIGDIPLFDRSSHPITPTAAGNEFIQHASNILEDYKQLMHSMQKYKWNDKNKIVIGAIPVMRQLGILDLIRDFQQKLPDSKFIDIIDRANHELLNMILANHIDAAFIITDINQPMNPSLTCYNLIELETVAVMNINHKLAKQSIIDISDIAKETLILFDEGTAIYQICTNAFKNNNIELKSIITRRNFENIIDLISFNEGISIMSKNLIQNINNPNIVWRKINKKINYNISLTVLNNTHFQPLLKKFIEHSIAWKFD